ncbi:MAG: hypothetical protein KGQ66_14180 [Acidobacteriota bacterium]|nr:hypothetical protein [Acidobacteriota bacterium]
MRWRDDRTPVDSDEVSGWLDTLVGGGDPLSQRFAELVVTAGEGPSGSWKVAGSSKEGHDRMIFVGDDWAEAHHDGHVMEAAGGLVPAPRTSGQLGADPLLVDPGFARRS